ncbi:hypothetical protein [Bacillus alkalicellulosilyticus]|uniref:hypothetical protein n=1 Tax=Alkalihalobacterium alkalicellulosilyticum TaxID=1912214 RepID=UPI000996824C|nr:hypothetical protein [Bacillus alkalicellulosilyticus]
MLKGKFEYIFHITMVVIGLVIIVSSLIGINESASATFYMIIGALIFISSLFRLYLIYNREKN